jgi:hypothetical protein
MSGLWGAPGVPQRGWVCIAMDDLGAPSEICEMCGHAQIRYVHVMRHQGYPDDLRCGCVCAGYMAEDMRAAEKREKTLKQEAGIKARWLTRGWKNSWKGNQYINVAGNNVVVFRHHQKDPYRRPTWGFKITRIGSEEGAFSTEVFKTADEAKSSVLTLLLTLYGADAIAQKGNRPLQVNAD